jgi:hypothetical protein
MPSTHAQGNEEPYPGASDAIDYSRLGPLIDDRALIWETSLPELIGVADDGDPDTETT